MASHHRRKALQHLRITSGRTVLRRAVAAAVSVAAAGGRSAEVASRRQQQQHPTPMAHQSVAWRLQQQQASRQPLPVVHLLLVSRRPPVQLQSKAANPQFHLMLQRLSQQPSLALNWLNANTQDLPRQRQRQRLAPAAAASAGSWWRSFIRGSCRGRCR